MRDKIKLVSSAGTGFFYTTDKNKRNMPGKMEIKKNLILLYVSTLCSKRPKSSNKLAFVSTKTQPLLGFLLLSI